MVRFARAKGSKSSNERIANDATPWHVMKEQLEMSQANEQQKPQAKTKTAKELIKEKDDLFYSKSLGNVNADWAEFENSKSNKNVVKSGKIEKKTKKKDKKLKNNEKIEFKQSPAEDLKKTESKKKIVENEITPEAENQHKVDVPPVNSNSVQFKDKKRKKKNKNISENSSTDENKNSVTPSETVVKNKNEAINSGGISNKLSKRQKRNQKKLNQKSVNENDGNASASNASNTEGNDLDSSVSPNKKQKVDNKDNGYNDRKAMWSKMDLDQKNAYRFGNNVPKKYQKKVAKVRDDGDHPRRKQEAHSIKVTINGMDVEVVKYDGFPIQKDDAERLTALRKELAMKGIPKSEIDAAMKLERRKCEKALARIRKQVCFHCRKAGHNLSDCPELGREEAGTGICFKCGSTEHTHFECRVNKSDDYKFAKCFICREQGHIAKQCPDNPKGLYPDGGSCKICGDVTHLKKDCPDLFKEKEEASITLDTIRNSNLESLDDEIPKLKSASKPSKKIVKF